MLTTLIYFLFFKFSMQETIERYEKHTRDNQANNKVAISEQNVQVMPLFVR